jgi:hypothetical protein
VACRWFSPCTLVSSTNKTDHHNITEIMLRSDVKVVLFFFQHKFMTIDDNVIFHDADVCFLRALLYDFDKSILCRTEY